MPSSPPIQSCRVAKHSLAASVVHVSTLNEVRGGGLQKRYIRFSHDFGFKNKSIYLRDFKDVDFNFTYFASFKFAYFEIEVSFGLIWLKWPISLANFHFGYSKGALFK